MCGHKAARQARHKGTRFQSACHGWGGLGSTCSPDCHRQHQREYPRQKAKRQAAKGRWQARQSWPLSHCHHCYVAGIQPPPPPPGEKAGKLSCRWWRQGKEVAIQFGLPFHSLLHNGCHVRIGVCGRRAGWTRHLHPCGGVCVGGGACHTYNTEQDTHTHTGRGRIETDVRDKVCPSSWWQNLLVVGEGLAGWLGGGVVAVACQCINGTMSHIIIRHGGGGGRGRGRQCRKASKGREEMSKGVHGGGNPTPQNTSSQNVTPPQPWEPNLNLSN